MRFLLRAYPRRWRERYGDELLALLEAEQPLTWRVRANVLVSGVGERLRRSGPPQLRVLWAWSFFVIGGMAFQKTSEHWQVVVPEGDRGIPRAAFDTVQVAAAVGTAAVLIGVALALPALRRDLRRGGWTTLRRPILTAVAATTVTAAALAAVALGGDASVSLVFVASALCSLFGWTHAATVAGRRLEPLHAHSHLALVVSATMVVMTFAAGVWFVSVTAHAPSFVGGLQLAVTAVFMLLGIALAAGAVRAPREPQRT
jgi:hypothetical protein